MQITKEQSIFKIKKEKRKEHHGSWKNLPSFMKKQAGQKRQKS
jgi:hypothetical protein